MHHFDFRPNPEWVRTAAGRQASRCPVSELQIDRIDSFDPKAGGPGLLVGIGAVETLVGDGAEKKGPSLSVQ